MDKQDAIRIISNAAKQYDDELRNKAFLIVFGIPNAPSSIEVIFPKKSFLHLTGVQLDESHLLRDVSDKDAHPSEVFFQKALYHKLSADDFSLKNDGTSEQKLRVLCTAINIMKNAKIIGDFNHNRPKLQSDKITGSIYSCIGLIPTGKYYVPNTVLATDTRKEIQQSQRVLAVLSGKFDEPYSSIHYVAKKIDIHRLLEKVAQKKSIAHSLLKQENVSVTEKNNTRVATEHRLPERQHDTKQATHDTDDQDSAPGASPQSVKQKPFTLSGARRSELAAEAKRAGHKDRPQQRQAQTHSRDDDLLS